MKKALSIIISAIILVSSVFSVTAFAADKTKTETLFEKYNETKEIAVTLSKIDHVTVAPNEEVEVLFPNDLKPGDLQRRIHVEEPVEAPIQQGQKLGTMDLYHGDTVYATVDLLALHSVERWEILQIYLRAEQGVTARIRQVTEGDETRYYYTEKRRISAMSCQETEQEVSEAEYRLLLRQDNADIRMTAIGAKVGLVSPERLAQVEEKYRLVKQEMNRLESTGVPASDKLNAMLTAKESIIRT